VGHAGSGKWQVTGEGRKTVIGSRGSGG
jgi:hypothetical protein